MPATAAKQGISRAVAEGSLFRTKGIQFPHREAFVYLKDQRGSEEFVQKLWEALVATNSIAAHCLSAIHARGGMIPLGHFAGVSGCPERLAKQIPPDGVLEFLMLHKLVTQRDVQELGACIQLSESLPFSLQSTPTRMKARLLAEDIVIGHLAQWFSQLGLMAHSSYKVRSHQAQPEFGKFHWDMTCPSYVHPFASFQKGDKPSPGFIVADVSIADHVTLPQVQSFLRKCGIIRHQRNSRPFLSLLVVDHFANDAFRAVRKSGSMAVSTRNLLGDDLAQALKTLVTILSSTAQAASTKPEVIYDVLGKLSAIEGAAANLRGPLFELIVGHCVGQVEGGTVEVQKAIRQPGTPVLTDVDVLRLKLNQEVTCYECKGNLGHVEVGKPEVEKWVSDTIPKIREYLLTQEQYQSIKHRFEFWTTGRLDEGALAYLLQKRQQVKKYEIGWKDGREVLEYVSRARAGKLSETLRQHYLEHPLPKSSRKLTRDLRETSQDSSEAVSAGPDEVLSARHESDSTDPKAPPEQPDGMAQCPS